MVTGKPGSGKTTWVMNLARLLSKEFIQVGGICSAGVWEEGIRDQFYVKDLENGHQRLLCDHENSGHDIPFGHFFFKKKGLDFGLTALNKVHFTHPDVLIIDEVGGLELQNGGWSRFLGTLDDELAGTVIMVVRESLIDQVVKHWKLVDYQIIRPEDLSPVDFLPTIRKERLIFDRKRRMPVTGIILAGGKSSRFGMDKGMVRFRNRSLMEIALERFNALCDNVLISSNSDIYQDLGYPVIRDEVNDCGPMMGIYSCLRESATHVNLVVSVDTPLVPAGLYRELLRVKEDAQVVVPSSGEGKFEPVIGLYERTVLESMEKLFAMNNYTLPDLFRRIHFKQLTIGRKKPFSNRVIFANINTPGDLTLIGSSVEESL
jgi:molybdopterin-guanine dinucleotide biosynthesis protein A